MFDKGFWQKRKNKKELKRKGIIIEDTGSAKDVESIIRDFMESIGWTIQDFPELLKSLDITTPVVIHNFMGGNDRLKFYEANDREGDLRLVFAYKNEAENYEVKPIIQLHSQQYKVSRTETYEIATNLGTVQATMENSKRMSTIKKFEPLIIEAANEGLQMVKINCYLTDIEKLALEEIGYTITESNSDSVSYIKW